MAQVMVSGDVLQWEPTLLQLKQVLKDREEGLQLLQ